MESLTLLMIMMAGLCAQIALFWVVGMVFVSDLMHKVNKGIWLMAKRSII